jgi:hypothetical protein
VIEEAVDFPCSCEVLAYGGLIHLGAGEDGGYDESLEEIVSKHPECISDFADLE